VCTTANGCFRKVNETGGSSYPSSNTGWSEETALDLDMVSATCPYCHILLVEASSNGYNDLGAAVDEAASLGAAAISNSYGGSEWSGEATEDPHYDHPGIAVTASAGDGDYGVEYPAASPYVTAVGGTSLRQASTARGWTETVWGSQLVQGRYQGTGSGCSAYEPQPAPQAALGLTACSHRMVADVAADADPYTGVAVYDTEGGEPGWMVFGGTSAASPLIASVYALSGQTAGQGASLAYANTASLFDVTSGSNSPSGCSPSYLCTGQVGYDGPTGLGTPDGLSAF
jgi:subtilase family serine protease